MVARLVRDQKVVGSNPVASTKNRRSAFAGLRFFAVRPSLDVRTFGPKPNALSRKGSRKNRAASFVGKGGTSRPVKPRGTQRRTLRLCSDAGTKRSCVPPSPRPSLLHEKAARQKPMKNNAFFLVFCYFDFEKKIWQLFRRFGRTYVRI